MTETLDRIRGALVDLKMPRALEALDHTMEKLEQGEISGIAALDALLSEEYATRETRRIEVALKTAKLMPIKTLEGFDFSFQPSLDRERIAALAQLDFIRRAEVVHFLGPPGTGKFHLATALCVAAVKADKQVYRATLAELIEALVKAEHEGRLVDKIRFYARPSLLIVPSQHLCFAKLPAGQRMRSVTCQSPRAVRTSSSNRSTHVTKRVQ